VAVHLCIGWQPTRAWRWYFMVWRCIEVVYQNGKSLVHKVVILFAVFPDVLCIRLESKVALAANPASSSRAPPTRKGVYKQRHHCNLADVSSGVKNAVLGPFTYLTGSMVGLRCVTKCLGI
jgi:hypothetical protein